MKADIYDILISIVHATNLPDDTKAEFSDAIREMKKKNTLGSSASLDREEIGNVRSANV
jgi:hypothetical protein